MYENIANFQINKTFEQTHKHLEIISNTLMAFVSKFFSNFSCGLVVIRVEVLFSFFSLPDHKDNSFPTYAFFFKSSYE